MRRRLRIGLNQVAASSTNSDASQNTKRTNVGIERERATLSLERVRL